MSKICVQRNLNVRSLKNTIQSNEYERLSEKTKNKLITNEKLKLPDLVQDTILVKSEFNQEKLTEYALRQIILNNLDNFLKWLGNGFCYVGNEYKIKIGSKYNYIDLLLYNVKYKCFVIIELKVTELKEEHIGQIQNYMNYVDKVIKKPYHDKTIGIIICARNDTREMVNENYRKNLLKLHSLIPLAGERMICRKNNWSIESEGINLVNGLIGNVAKSPGIHDYDNKLNTFKIDFKPIYTDGLFTDLECDYKYLNSNIKQRKFLKNARYSHGEKLEYAYAITVHSSQGSQFNNGIYVEERFAPEIKNKLNYTAITRFKDRIIYVKDRPKMYYNISY